MTEPPHLQTQLQGEDVDSLKALGLSSGDLLFLLDFSTLSSPPAAQSAPLPLPEPVPMDLSAGNSQLQPAPGAPPSQPEQAQPAQTAAPSPAESAHVSVSDCSSFMTQLQALWITVQTQLEDVGLQLQFQVSCSPVESSSRSCSSS